jgi:hypothetical protein
MSHPCPIRPCRVRALPDRYLMCGDHWAMVPPEIQRSVYQAYHGPGVGSVELLDAQRIAIDAVVLHLEPL